MLRLSVVIPFVFTLFIEQSPVLAAEQKLPDIVGKEISELKSDLEILRSLEEINKQLIELPVKISPAMQGAGQPDIKQENISQKQTLIDEPLITDDELALDEMLELLSSEIADDEPLFNEKALPVLNHKKPLTQPNSLPGVGIKGKDEELINVLDGSNLMDFEQGIDVWSKGVKKKTNIE